MVTLIKPKIEPFICSNGVFWSTIWTNLELETRREGDGGIEPADEGEHDFYSIYVRHEEGRAQWLADVVDKEQAENLIGLLSKIMNLPVRYNVCTS